MYGEQYCKSTVEGCAVLLLLLLLLLLILR